MSELIEKFEKTKTFKYFCSTLIKFDESLDCYVALEKWRNKEAKLLTASWWMFKEQQYEIDRLDKDKEHLIEMNKRYIGKMQEQQDMLAYVKNIINKNDRYIPYSITDALRKVFEGEL